MSWHVRTFMDVASLADEPNADHRNYDDSDKENHHLRSSSITLAKPPEAAPFSGGGPVVVATKRRPHEEFMCMERRLLISTLNELFLDQVKVNLIERAHEFTDCAYTKHEHREDILMLLQCIRFQLNKLVKILYKCVSSLALDLGSFIYSQPLGLHQINLRFSHHKFKTFLI